MTTRYSIRLPHHLIWIYHTPTICFLKFTPHETPNRQTYSSTIMLLNNYDPTAILLPETVLGSTLHSIIEVKSPPSPYYLLLSANMADTQPKQLYSRRRKKMHELSYNILGKRTRVGRV